MAQTTIDRFLWVPVVSVKQENTTCIVGTTCL